MIPYAMKSKCLLVLLVKYTELRISEGNMEHIWPYNTVLHQQGVGMLGMGVAFIVIIELMRSVFQAWFSPLKQVPGPFLARYSRLWELFSVTRGKSHRNIIKLHEKYGVSLRNPTCNLTYSEETLTNRHRACCTTWT